jgi:hypothetical protein
LSIGITGGDANERKSLPCLLGRHRGLETSMAKSRPAKVSDETRFTVLGRNGYKCEKCGEDFLWGVSVHHRRPRMMGGSKNELLHQPANLIALCGSGTTGCHGWVESHRDKARELGYLIMKVESAEDIPFCDNSGKWWKIDNLGQKEQLDLNRANFDA